jgi:hypothetical protein
MNVRVGLDVAVVAFSFFCLDFSGSACFFLQVSSQVSGSNLNNFYVYFFGN